MTMKTKAKCTRCGGPLKFCTKFKHAKSGKVMHAWMFGKKAFAFCANNCNSH